MNDELKHFLQRGPTTAKELQRLTGMSISAVYKALKSDDVITHDGKPAKYSVAAPLEGAGAQPMAEPKATPTAKANVAPAPAPAGKRGRKPLALGKALYPSPTLLSKDSESGAGTYTNPRRKNSHGARSLQIIIDNPGIATEEYLAKGGRLNDLNWDIAHGNVKAE